MVLVRAPWGRQFRKVFLGFRGGPGFIIALTVVVLSWTLWNLFAPLAWRYDEHPFVLLNLLLSIEAAYTMPVMWMESVAQSVKETAALDDIARRVKEVLARMDELDQEEGP